MYIPLGNFLFPHARIITIASGIIVLAWLKKEKKNEEEEEEMLLLSAGEFATFVPNASFLCCFARCGHAHE